MRFLWGVVVGVIGGVITYFAAIKLGAIGEMAAGTTVGTGLRIIIAGGGIAVTIALVVSAVNQDRKKSPSS